MDGLGYAVVEVQYSYVLNSNNSSAPTPIVPNTYKVSYSIKSGDNYSMKLNGEDALSGSQVFVISKAASIDVSISRAITGLSYNGTDLTDDIFALAQMSATATVDGSTAQPSVKLTIVNKGKDTGVASYSVEKGIMVYASIYKDDANSPLAQVVDAGTYHLKVYYPAGISGYNINTYTNFLTFNGSVEAIIDFTIDKQSFSIDIDTLMAAWGSPISGEVIKIENLDGSFVLQVSTTTMFNIIETMDYDGLKLYKVSDEYAICIKVNSNGFEGDVITDFENYGFASSMFGSSDRAYIFVYKYNQIDNVYRSIPAIDVQIVVIPEPEPEPEP